MPESQSQYSGAPRVAIDSPACPKCQVSMMLARIKVGSRNFDSRTFECVKCGHVKKVFVATDPMHVLMVKPMERPSNTDASPLRRHAADALRRARKLPVGHDRNDLRQLAIGLRWLEKRGFVATPEDPASGLHIMKDLQS
jgi:hypothetical protein